MKLCNIGHSFDYELEKLIRIFLPFEKIEITHEAVQDKRLALCKRTEKNGSFLLEVTLSVDLKTAQRSTKTEESLDDTHERLLAVALYECFAELTGIRPKWGILTGVRPAKLFSRLARSMGENAAEEYFEKELLVSKRKISLCREAVSGEERITSRSSPNSFSLYLSVPFCPTRCTYCSFVSHSIDKASKMIPQYVEYLCRELEQTALIVGELGLRLDTVYMGGGTPTTLSAEQLDKVLKTVRNNFDLSKIEEFTVEAGRPDTFTSERLEAIKRNGVSRISINPQTMNDDVLLNIGRKHTAEQTVEAFKMARGLGFDNINMDLIAGLPGDTPESFANTIKKVLALDPESVTVHSLAMKRAAILSTDGLFSDICDGESASEMVEYARQELTRNSVVPYYMYRQSKTVGNLENVGYAKPGYEGLYNVYIMDETHSILACGASAVTKLRQPGGTYIERIFNFKYPYEYISRFEEQLERKKGIKRFYEQYR